MMMAGARDNTVKISRSWILDETSWGVAAGSTLKPNLKGKVVSAYASELKRVMIVNAVAILRPRFILIISIVNPVFIITGTVFPVSFQNDPEFLKILSESGFFTFFP